MPIPDPILDTRSYAQLRDELIRRIPVYAPEWTDHNASDPGVTLLELAAHLGENLAFLFNQIPGKTFIQFLRLLRIPLRSGVPSRALFAMTTDTSTGAVVDAGSEVRAGNISFETLQEAVVWPVSSVAVARARSTRPDAAASPEAAAFAERSEDALSEAGLLGAGTSAAYYENRFVPEDGDGLPVDFSATVDGKLWIALLGENGADPLAMAGGLINIGFVPDPQVTSMDDVDACPGTGNLASSPPIEWQISTGVLTNGVPKYTRLTVEADVTRGLTQSGILRLRLPKAKGAFGPFVVADEDLLGTGDLPPALDDPRAAKVLAWLRAFRPNGAAIGRVQHIGVNEVELRQTRKAKAEFLGTGNAQPNQRFRLVNRPVYPESIVLEVEELPGDWRPWSEVDGFHASGPEARVFEVDAEAGEIHFGTGLQGYPPQLGQRVRVLEYRHGGGADGNVAAKAIDKLFSAAAVKGKNPLAARGGANAETIAEALDRIPGELRRRDRAVTASDFQELALMTPGAAVGRAECLPRFFPPTRMTEAAGVVSVVVWPKEDVLHPAAAMPDRELLRAVCRYLDQRRLVTTELYVIPPTYRKVAVSVGLQVKPGYGLEAVRRWVEIVLRQYLNPLPPFGPSGQGWPLGRRVHGPELEAAALQVEGVEFLEGLEVAQWNAAMADWVPGTVELAAYEVPELTTLTVTSGPPLPAGRDIDPVPSPSVPVPVPVIRKEC